MAKKAISKKADATNGTAAVTAFMQQLNHPLKQEIEAVRKIILAADNKIAERVKWNAPSFYYKEDMATIHVKATQHVHVIFHYKHIAQIQSPILRGDYKDRRMAYFKTIQEVEQAATEIHTIMQKMVAMADEAL